MSESTPGPKVVHNEQAHRFEAAVPSGTAHADYQRVGDALQMIHTEVPDASQNRGVAAALVTTAFAYAEKNGLRIVPTCGYVRSYMRKHPETHSLLAPGTQL